jgi:acyl carrier protein phosphodiesterase
MRIQISVCVFVILFFLFGQIYASSASSTNNFSFHGAGVIIDLTFPEEAHSTESITHNLTITAKTSLTLENFTMITKVLVNSSWQQVYKEQVFFRDMLQNENLTSHSRFTLPQNAHGRLHCFLYLLTDKTADPLSYTFYTTHVRTLTYSELLVDYDKMFANYSELLTEYETLLESYNELTATYGTLNSTYNSLLNEYNTLQSNYSSLNSTYHSLQATYSSLLFSYYSLEANFNSLNQTCTTLEDEINNLRQKTDASKIEIINTRNLTYLFVGTTIALIILIIYLKKKKPEPYVVIRKETVAVKPTEDS